MKNIIARILMGLGLICIICSIGLIVFNSQEDTLAGDLSQEAIPFIISQMPEVEQLPEEIAETYSGDMPAIDVDGFSYIGLVTIPAIDIELPIQAEWSKEKARTSPCRYKGSVYENDLIVAGHNYTRHFGKLRELNSGDEVIITDVNGNSFYYVVTYMETIGTEEVEKMDEGDWDLTVFTCTLGGASRVTVRCAFTGKIEYYKEIEF